MDQTKELREHLAAALKGGLAFDTFENVIKDFKPADRGRIPPGSEHSAWQIVEHLRLSLEDILEFSNNEDGSYKEKDWPAGYWPKESLGNWDATVNEYLQTRVRLEKLVADGDLYRVFPWGDGQTLLREAILAGNHEAYHVGELVELQRWLEVDRP
jgi:hypothetical protein